MSEWRTILEAVLRSILVHLAAPVLTIDQRGRAWSNKQFMQAITYIFAWPKNISQNMIYLMMGMENTEYSLYKQLIRGGTHPDTCIREDYALMAQLFIQGGIKSYITENALGQEDLRQLEQQEHNSKIIRNHFDPARELHVSTEMATNKERLIWLVTNHVKNNYCTTTLMLFIGNNPETNQRGSHLQHLVQDGLFQHSVGSLAKGTQHERKQPNCHI